MSHSDTQLDSTDLRAKLPTPEATRTVPTTAGFGRVQTFALSQLAPQSVQPDGTESWTIRGQNFVVGYTQARGPVTLDVENCPDEYILIVLGDAVDVELSADGQRSQRVTEPSVVVVPPGRSAITAHGPCLLIRVFPQDGALPLHAVNESFYLQSDPRIAPVHPRPTPSAGYRLRVYPLSAVQPDPAVFGRIYRCSTLMVNLFDEQIGPRDPNKLSPHSHDDFEQCTITVAGDYVHHCRTPWAAMSELWRPDEHHESPSPSIVIIPPGVVHTSQAVGDGTHILIDVFSPSRQDFEDAGWVRNSEDYPAVRG